MHHAPWILIDFWRHPLELLKLYSPFTELFVARGRGHDSDRITCRGSLRGRMLDAVPRTRTGHVNSYEGVLMTLLVVGPSWVCVGV